MDKNIFYDLCKYLHNLENSNNINKEIINLSNKIENFCFKCNKEILNNKNSYSLFDVNVKYSEECKCDKNFSIEDMNIVTSFDECSLEDISYNACEYLEHDILNKYLYLSDYLKSSYDKEKSIVYLNNIVISKNLTNSNIVNKSTIDGGLLSRILNGKSDVTKDTAIKLCIGLDLNYDESIDLLLRFGYTLSTLNKRDCIIRYGIDNNLSVNEIDYLLYTLKEKELLRK